MLATRQLFGALNRTKANFDDIYDLPDPREYFRVLCGLDYVIPELAKGIFRTLIERCNALHGRPSRVLDIGCSYGINPALVRFPLDIQRLSRRYSDPRMLSLDDSQVIELDWHYFRSWPSQVDAKFIGLDTSRAAIAYATRVGLIDFGINSNLEQQAPTPYEAEQLRGLDLIISTGCIGYVTGRTFDRILSLQRDQMPWIGSFVLRMFPYDEIAARLESFGLVTEKLEGVTFVQRRFHSEDECQTTLSALDQQGIDPEGKETEGLYHAEFFLSRPKEQARAAPLRELVSVTSGENRLYGRRYRQIGPGGIKLVQ
jgi:SAM-dependent methyltransferase